MSASPAVYESLAKLIAYVDDRPEFQSQVTLFLNSVGYRIDRSFDDPTTGFHAVGLVSTTSDKPPVLVFRGTDGASDDSALGDRRAIGFNQIEANRSAISDWLTRIAQDASNPDRLLPDAIGHSLGGALAQLTAAQLTSLVGDIVTFNSPGTSRAAVDTFLGNGGAGEKVTHYVVNGDIVSLGGEAFLPGTAILQSFTDPQIDPTLVLPGDPILARDKHTRRDLLSNPPSGFSQTEISVEQLNSPAFTYTNDSSFREFSLALAVANLQLLVASSTRGALEFTRTSEGFSFLGLINLALTALNPINPNLLVGDGLNNFALASQGNDSVFGEGGNDTLFGGQSNDLILGGRNDDLLFGDRGADTIYGGRGNDTLLGGNGDDFLGGDFGVNILTGGGGSDRFVIQPSRGIDTVLDFNMGEDFLELADGLQFSDISLEQNGLNTLVRSNSDGQSLMFLNNVIARTIGLSDFLSMPLPFP
jgi:serralysin